MLWITIALLLSITVAGAQSSSETSRKNLQRMRSSIESTRKRIDALQRRESTTMKSLSGYQRQRKQVRAIISGLESDLRALQDSVSTIEKQIHSTTTARQRVEADFDALAFSAVVYDSERPGDRYADAGDAFVLEHIARRMQEHRATMLTRQDSLTNEQQILNSTSSEQERLLSKQAAEGRRLANTISSRKNELDRIRNDKTLLLKELASKRASANTLSAMIGRQEAASKKREQARRDASNKREQARRDASKSEAGRRTTKSPSKDHVDARSKNDRSSDLETDSRSYSGVGGFSANSLPWPTPSRSLIHGYGVYRNRETGTTLDNPGIDIRSPIGTRMTCVAAGVVSSVTWLPGFGSLVIVDHKNGFRTVYANLTSVSVGIGSSVQAGTVIGSSGESIDGPTAHFEVWRGRDRQNPLTYLR